MSADGRRETEDRDAESGELSEDIVASCKVQERGGSYQVSIPKAGARELGIDKGENVLFTGSEGEDKLRLRKLDLSALEADETDE